MLQSKEKLMPFSEGTRCLLLLERKKDGNNSKSSNCLKRILTKNSEEFFEAIEELEIIKKEEEEADGTGERGLRIYSSVNSRNIDKAVRQLKHDIVDNDYNPDEVRRGFYLDIKNRFIHCLMKPSCKDESNFLFDIDNCCERSLASMEKELSNHTEILLRYKTKNGFHIITKPFNHSKLDDRFSGIINPDGLMLISF